MPVRIHIQPRFQEVIELNRWAWEQRLKGYIIIALGIALVITGVGVSFVQENGPDPFPVILFGGIFILMGMAATTLAGVGAWVHKRGWRPYLVEVSSEGVAVTTEGSERVEAGWEAFKPFYETPNLLVLPIRNVNDSVAIPKRCCSHEQLSEVRNLLARNLSN
jgi:hypothetical protein